MICTSVCAVRSAFAVQVVCSTKVMLVTCGS